MLEFYGCPADIGGTYGKACGDRILSNLKELVYREGHPPLPRDEPLFRNWVRRQEELFEQRWPWLLEEMGAVATGCGVAYEDILLLNLRAWQYEYYGRSPAGGCSSLAITLADGSVACAGTLDDPSQYYCGPVRFMPENGYHLITFPIAGTSWANRGMNSHGLALGISSQLLPGLAPLPQAINQDLALRVILQTCATVDEVRAFCQSFAFTLNLVCVDAQGGMFAAHHTAAGLFELPVSAGWCALTNHVSDDAVGYALGRLGVKTFPENQTTRPRRGKLVAFCEKHNSACTLQAVQDLIGSRDDDDLGSLHKDNTLYLTCANPQVDPKTLWLMQPGKQADFKKFVVVEEAGTPKLLGKR